MDVRELTSEQRILAVQRLTALWAFSESGLGGVLHSMQVPFTGLVVGGFAVVLISLIGYFSDCRYRQIFQSLIVVLIIKAVVSPHTPFPAYLAVSFQAVTGFLLFSLLRINTLSLVLLSVLALVESAVQKLLVLTLFFGKSFWKAADELVRIITKQFSLPHVNSAKWIVGTYISIHVVAGVLIGLMIHKIIRSLSLVNEEQAVVQVGSYSVGKRRRVKKRVILTAMVLLVMSVALYVVAENSKEAFASILKAIVWTVSALALWYFVVNPLLTRFIKSILKKRQSQYSSEVLSIISFLPVIKQITVQAWEESAMKKQFRLSSFLSILINRTLTYNEVPGE